MMKRYLVLIVFFMYSFSLTAQTFKGFSAFEKLVEYEGQRYLMNEVYQIKTEGFDNLKIDMTIKEVDANEGFMFVLISYIFNDNKGVVITSFNSNNVTNSKYEFVNIHLTDKEFENLFSLFNETKELEGDEGEHFLRRFNNRMIIDFYKIRSSAYFTLWIDDNRHTFYVYDWDKAYKKYLKFTNK